MGVSTSTTSGRPDDRVESYLYSNQFVETREFSFNFTEQQMKDRVKELELEQISGDVSFIAPYYFNGVTITTAYNTGSGYFITDTIGNDTYFASIGDLVYIFGDNGKLLVIRILTVGIQLQLANMLFIWAGSSTYGNRAEIVPELCIGEFNNATDIQTGFPVGTKLYICSVKQNNHLSQGTRLHTDIIGSIENYPSSKLNRLAENKPLIGQYLLLVDDSGNSMIPDGSMLDRTVSNKSTEELQAVFTGDGGDSWSTWNTFQLGFTSITNSFSSTMPSSRVAMCPYTSQNTAQSSIPKQVIDVEPKVIATNSHSIYKGSAVGNCIGKVLTGNGENGYESKYLENGGISTGWNYTTEQDGVDIKIGDKVLVTANSSSGTVGNIYIRTTADLNNAYLSTTTGFGAGYWPLYSTVKPSHETLQLDNSVSAAVKYFNATSVENRDVFVSRFLQEMVWDYDLVTISAGVAFNYTASDSSLKIITFSGFDNDTFNGKLFITKNSWSATLNADYLADKYIKDGALYIYPDTLWTRFKPFNGNGFGDNNKFNQLTNGTETDLNGNTTSTKVINQFTGFKYKG
jgi:hypothetical protein